MFDAKTIRLAEALRPDLDFSVLGTEEFAILKIVENATGGGVVPVYDADIANGIASFSGVTKSKPLVSLKLNIPVTQTGSGTPSPTNIRDFVGVSGVNVSRTGKNLFDINSDKITGAYISSTGAIVYQAGQDIYTEKIKFKPSTQYTISGKSDTNTIIRIALYSANNSFIGRVLTTSMQNPVITITPTSQASYFVINPDNTITDIQVEEGQEATDYEPFGNTYTFTFGQSIYQGSIDWLRGVVVGNVVLADLGDRNWTLMTNANGDFFRSLSLPSVKETGIRLCSNYALGNPYAVTTDNIFFVYNSTDTVGGVLVRDARYTDPTAFKTAMNGVQLAYELATPIEIQLTPTVINTLIGENVIFADVGDITECKYTRK